MLIANHWHANVDLKWIRRRVLFVITRRSQCNVPPSARARGTSSASLILEVVPLTGVALRGPAPFTGTNVAIRDVTSTRPFSTGSVLGGSPCKVGLASNWFSAALRAFSGSVKGTGTFRAPGVGGLIAVPYVRLPDFSKISYTQPG